MASEDQDNGEGLELALNDDGLFAASTGEPVSGCVNACNLNRQQVSLCPRC